LSALVTARVTSTVIALFLDAGASISGIQLKEIPYDTVDRRTRFKKYNASD
jgi:hypothetical protein